jgi:hypothetical protein
MENSGIILKHLGIVEFIILILILILYYSKKIPKEHLTICLLGSYILIKSITYYIHGKIITNKKINLK